MNFDKQTEHFQCQGKSQNDLLLEDESWSMTPFAPLLLLNHQAAHARSLLGLFDCDFNYG